MAIPGSPLDARSHGCNQLIREGAVLVQSADDVIELVAGFDGVPRSSFREAVLRQYSTRPKNWRTSRRILAGLLIECAGIGRRADPPERR